MTRAEMDQSALARAAGCTPGAINQIVNGGVRRSRFLPDIAAALDVTLEWLCGGDGELPAGKPQPRSSPRQEMLLPVLLPSEAALTRAFQGILMASRKMDEAALAHELAKRLPRMLGLLRGPMREMDDGEATEVPTSAPPARRRA